MIKPERLEHEAYARGDYSFHKTGIGRWFWNLKLSDSHSVSSMQSYRSQEECFAALKKNYEPAETVK